MTLDLIDRAFLERWRTEPRPRDDGRHDSPSAPAATDPAATDLVDRLLAAAPGQWENLADHVEAARGRGRRTIAIAAAARGAGCSTVTEGLARTLRGRGRDVTVCGLAVAGHLAPTGAPHDDRIILVDAGVWFPQGPIRRQRLACLSLGCDAVIVVRRADRAAAASWASAVSAIGVEPLGEVLSFASPVDVAGEPHR